MKALANENFPAPSTRLLREAEWDVKSIKEDMPGISDEKVLRVAVAERHIILTFDQDYGELLFRYRHNPLSIFGVKEILPQQQEKCFWRLLNVSIFRWKVISLYWKNQVYGNGNYAKFTVDFRIDNNIEVEYYKHGGATTTNVQYVSTSVLDVEGVRVDCLEVALLLVVRLISPKTTKNGERKYG